MKNTYVGIDASITSTVVCIEENGIDRYICYTTAPKLSKWMNLLEPAVIFKHLTYNYPKNYSDSEIYKTEQYKKTADLILYDLPDNCIIGMESYSQSSDAGHLIDLVMLGTYIRSGILQKKNSLSLYAPMSVKKQACIMAYNNYDEKKKVWRDDEGLAGGSFKKHEMIKAMLKYTNGNKSTLSDLVRNNSNEILSLKGIPKPYDDCCDAFWIKEFVKSK